MGVATACSDTHQIPETTGGGGSAGAGDAGGGSIDGWEPYTDLPPALAPPYDPQQDIHIHGKEDEYSLRALLIQRGWGGSLPTSLPRNIPVVDEDLEGVSGFHSAEHWKTSYSSSLYVLYPPDSNGRAVIVHHGHVGYAWRWIAGVGTLITHLLNRGFVVAAMQMPLYGWNIGPWGSHYEMIEQFGDGAIAEFVGPVIETVNRLHGNYIDISMMGLSGGGWTTVFASAIDTRIRRSAPVAGSLPISHRQAYEEMDGPYPDNAQQDYMAIFKDISYEDLYLLGATEGREQVQINNQYDECCFYGVSGWLYAPVVRQAASGEWSFHLDASHRKHLISSEAMVVIDELLD